MSNQTRLTAGLLCALLALGAAACTDEPTPLFEVPGTGSLSGLVFLDADRDTRFDPSAGDLALPGINLRLLVRGTSEVVANSAAATNAAGRFDITGLPVGSHELAIDTVGVGAGVRFCQNPIPVTVYLNEPQFQSVAARGGCVISIAEAVQLAAGEPATVRGTVVSSPGQINTSDRRMYVQDGTGGIRVDNIDAGGANIVIGDVAEVTGVRDAVEQELVIGSAVLGTLETGGAQPTAALVTTQAIADAGPILTDPLQGTLVRVQKARVTAAWGDNTGSSRNAIIDDGSGPVVIRVETGVLFTPNAGDLDPALNALMGFDKCYDVVGIATSFRAGAELFPRTVSDITEVPCN